MTLLGHLAPVNKQAMNQAQNRTLLIDMHNHITPETDYQIGLPGWRNTYIANPGAAYPLSDSALEGVMSTSHSARFFQVPSQKTKSTLCTFNQSARVTPSRRHDTHGNGPNKQARQHGREPNAESDNRVASPRVKKHPVLMQLAESKTKGARAVQ